MLMCSVIYLLAALAEILVRHSSITNSFSLWINEMPSVLPANLRTLSSDLLSVFPQNVQEIHSCQNYNFKQMYVVQKHITLKSKVFFHLYLVCSVIQPNTSFFIYFSFYNNSLKQYAWIADSVEDRYFNPKYCYS